MARRPANADIASSPLWETHARKTYPNGMVQGTDGSMWVYRTVPMAPVLNAKSIEEALRVGSPLYIAFNELAGLATGRGFNRRMVRKSYREVHGLLTNYPTWFRAPESSPIAGYLNRAFAHEQVLDRRLIIGVRLVATNGDGSLRGFLDSATQTIFEGGTPVSDFDSDYTAVSSALARAGLGIPSDNDLRAADAWWNYGQTSDTPVMPHVEHLHFFRGQGGVADALRSPEDCEPWLDSPEQSAITFCSVSDFDLGYTDVSDPTLWWAPKLIRSGARVISFRAVVEPPTITRQELKAQRGRVRSDLDSAYNSGKTDQAAREEQEAELDSIERAYDVNKDAMPATLVDTSIIVGFAGVPRDVSTLAPAGLTLHPMTNRQKAAWHETMICSNVRSNPYLHDLPATVLAYSALPNLSVVGDESGALVGFTEEDRQPAYLSPTAASAGDTYPLALNAAGTGSGKTVLAQWLAFQHAMLGAPTVFIDPKDSSDLRSTVQMAPDSKVVSIDNFLESDGGLDPLTFYPNPEQGIPLATTMLFNVNPWGDERRRTYEADIANALRYGVDKGATGTGQALKMAYEAGIVSREVVADVFKVAETYPMFRATFGMNPPAGGLATAKGITLFMRGRAELTLPPMTQHLNSSEMSATMRQSVNLLRMLVRGSMIALTGRGGVIHMDEAWVLERAAPDELNDIGRLARSQKVLPILYTQTPQGPLNLGLAGYISRGFLGHMSDAEQASAGLRLFRADTEAALTRVTAPEHLAGGQGLNWNSLKALRDPATKAVMRGAVFYYADLKERFAPVEVRLPADFLRLASTNPDDVAQRLRDGNG